MKALFDTNVLLDFFEEREPFVEHAQKALLLCAESGRVGFVCASSVTDIHYLLKKRHGGEAALRHVRTLLSVLDIAAVGKAELRKALLSGMRDFEDAVVAQSAARAKAEYIITRNIKGFEGSPVPALSPEAFIEKFSS